LIRRAILGTLREAMGALEANVLTIVGSARADGAMLHLTDQDLLKWNTPDGGPVPTPRRLLLDRSGAGGTTLYMKHGHEMAGSA
jgi:hypothetical protein